MKFIEIKEFTDWGRMWCDADGWELTGRKKYMASVAIEVELSKESKRFFTRKLYTETRWLDVKYVREVTIL